MTIKWPKLDNEYFSLKKWFLHLLMITCSLFPNTSMILGQEIFVFNSSKCIGSMKLLIFSKMAQKSQKGQKELSWIIIYDRYDIKRVWGIFFRKVKFFSSALTWNHPPMELIALLSRSLFSFIWAFNIDNLLICLPQHKGGYNQIIQMVVFGRVDGFQKNSQIFLGFCQSSSAMVLVLPSSASTSTST